MINGEENDLYIICTLIFTHSKISNHRSKMSVKLASENEYWHLETGKVNSSCCDFEVSMKVIFAIMNTT